MYGFVMALGVTEAAFILLVRRQKKPRVTFSGTQNVLSYIKRHMQQLRDYKRKTPPNSYSSEDTPG